MISLGVAVTAYTLGMRHAFDADHIAAIDNTTRKLRQDGQTPLSVGFWFSLGHSTVVVVLALGLVIAAHRIYGIVDNPASALRSVGGLLGTLVSALFLYAIAALNLKGLVAMLRCARTAVGDQPDAVIASGGPLYRVFGRLIARIRRPSGMYPVGLLFGLGFDTATEVALLAMTVSTATTPLPAYGVLALPCLFAAGMSLCDTIDGITMQYAYDWSLLQPKRRLLWNAAVTGLSVGVAFGVGTLEILGLLAQAWPKAKEVLGPLSRIDLGHLGLLIALGLVASWLLVMIFWHKRSDSGRLGQEKGVQRSDGAAQKGEPLSLLVGTIPARAGHEGSADRSLSVAGTAKERRPCDEQRRFVRRDGWQKP